jgi:transcriptional regulator with XRE-family HTH domain
MHSSGVKVAIGKKLKKRAIDLELTNAEVAKRVGVTEGAYYHYINDQREPNLRTLKNIAEVLQISLDDLLEVDKSRFSD